MNYTVESFTNAEPYDPAGHEPGEGITLYAQRMARRVRELDADARIERARKEERIKVEQACAWCFLAFVVGAASALALRGVP